MKFKTLSLIITTLLWLLKFKNFHFISYLREHYDEDAAKIFRKLISESKKLEKAKLDLEFLIKCKTYDVTPKFLRFKLYKKSLQSQQFYKSWQIKLLNHEINFKRRRISEIEELLKKESTRLDERISPLEQLVASHRLRKITHPFISKNRDTQNKKLENLGIFNQLVPVDPARVVHNFSSVKLPDRIRFLLAFGLQFNLPVFKLDFFKYFHPLEKITFSLNSKNCYGDKSEFLEKMKHYVNKFYYSFKPSKVFSPIFSASDIHLLKSFSKDHRDQIVVSKPDKGQGVVIVDRPTYLQSMITLISDQSKFSLISENILKYCFKIEDKVNRFLNKLKKSDIITPETYSELYASGSGPGVLYGLPKIHKPDFADRFQYRPILAAFKLASYKICKFLVPILAPLTTNEYTIENSATFAKFVQSVPNANRLFMSSFDVENLFTNIPLEETIAICLDSLFENSPIYFGFTRDLFRKFLELAVMNTFFVFDGKFYQQKEGVGMGLPLGPTLANIFMCNFENTWLSACPLEFKPVIYKRYVDDTFILFRDPSHAPLFLNYINSKHININFTMETEQNSVLPFLDVSVHRFNNTFQTTVFRKEMFSGLGISYFSFCCKIFKLNTIKTLLHRAYNICSSYNSLHLEFSFLINFFQCNGFPKLLLEQQINKFLCKKYTTNDVLAQVPRKTIFFSMLYFGHKSVVLKIKLLELINDFFPHLDVNIVLVNPYTIGSLFKFKDTVPKGLCSSLVYKFSCETNNCSSEYYGFTTRRLSTRVAEHRGTSVRTGHLLVNPPYSSIRIHAEQCSCDIELENFKIVASENSTLSLKILESLFIFKNRPNLNESSSSLPLLLVNH